VNRLDKILRNNEHCYFANDVDEVIELCEKLLKEDKEKLYAKSANAAKYYEEKHTDYPLMEFIINAKTNNGLCNSIINLAFNKDIFGRFCANHVDLSEINYEELVNKLAEVVGAKPYVITHYLVAKKRFNILLIIKKLSRGNIIIAIEKWII
jgi:hypothetical protein